MRGHVIVETQAAGVAQLQDRRRGESLGHGGDAVDGIGVRVALGADLARAEGVGEDKFRVHDHAIADAGHAACRRIVAKDRFELWASL